MYPEASQERDSVRWGLFLPTGPFQKVRVGATCARHRKEPLVVSGKAGRSSPAGSRRLFVQERPPPQQIDKDPPCIKLQSGEKFGKASRALPQLGGFLRPARAGMGDEQQGTSPQQGYKARFENWSMLLLELFDWLRGPATLRAPMSHDQRRHHLPPTFPLPAQRLFPSPSLRPRPSSIFFCRPPVEWKLRRNQESTSSPLPPGFCRAFHSSSLRIWSAFQ